jgi:hydroxypyruvate reductase
VNVVGSGRGGRNQELALAAGMELDGFAGVTVAALGTDGRDGPTDAAGAVADGATAQRARRLGNDPAGFLAENDSYTFFADLGDLLITGPTGTNVMDLHIALAEQADE